MNTNRSLWFPMLAVLTLSLWLAGCGSDDDDHATDTAAPAGYQVTLTNISANQPLSPMVVVLHGPDYSAWEVGSAASPEIEILAESGDPADLIAAADADPDVLGTARGAGVVMPGNADSVAFSTTADSPVFLTLATMLVNTNDAFGGVNGRRLDDLDVGQSVSFMAPAYDAGTEANSETMDTVPGPAGGGEGFNAARDDIDFVRIHPGIISSQDGLSGSALDSTHRWDNPVMKIVVTRTS